MYKFRENYIIRLQKKDKQPKNDLNCLFFDVKILSWALEHVSPQWVRVGGNILPIPQCASNQFIPTPIPVSNLTGKVKAVVMK